MKRWPESKQRLREEYLSRLKGVGESDRQRWSTQIIRRVSRLAAYQDAETILAFLSFPTEPQTRELITAARQVGKVVAIPAVVNGRIVPIETTTSDSVAQADGPVTTEAGRWLDSAALDLLLVPGLAFTKQGDRLGRGRGHFDRFLSTLPSRAPAIGLGYELQIVPSLPQADHDQRLTAVVTEATTYGEL